MALPPLTPDQRAAALEKAARARKERAEVKARLKKAELTLSQVLKDGQTDDILGKDCEHISGLEVEGRRPRALMESALLLLNRSSASKAQPR